MRFLITATALCLSSFASAHDSSGSLYANHMTCSELQSEVRAQGSAFVHGEYSLSLVYASRLDKSGRPVCGINGFAVDAQFTTQDGSNCVAGVYCQDYISPRPPTNGEG